MKNKNAIKSFVLIFGLLIGLFACNSEKPDEQKEENKNFKGVGVVKKIDTEKGEITIDHEEIKGLMSAMTMDFSVADKKLLESVKTGDKVEFELKKDGTEMTVISIKKIGEVAKINAAEIYKTNCAECHGEKGEGVEGKGISFLKGHALDHPEEDFIRQVTYGEEDEMPAFKDKLSKDEIKAVVKYVRDELQSKVERRENGGGHKH